MYLSYYKHPELQLLDTDRCKEYVESPKCELFLHMEHDKREYLSNSDGSDVHPIKGVVAHYKEALANGVMAHYIHNIYYVSKTFEAAMLKSSKVFEEMCKDTEVLIDIHEDCCLILNDEGENHFFLFCDGEDENGMRNYVLVNTRYTGVIIWLAEFSLYRNDRNGFGLKAVYRPEAEADYLDEGLSDAEMVWGIVRFVYAHLVFKKYGQVELETVSANKTLRKSQILGEKVNNFMGIDVKVLDSRWFTTICRDEGFLVSGHFRLQPCKDENGEWTRKLIYINPYAKHGYHRLAPIVNINNDNQSM